VVSVSDDNFDGIPVVRAVVVSIYAMVGTSCAVVVAGGVFVVTMINIPLGNDVGTTIKTVVCISYFTFENKTYVWVFEQT
jgi:hypothetical protein